MTNRFSAILLLFFSVVLSQTASADKIYTTGFWGIGKAVGGYDTVAYFTEGKPVKGNSKFSYEWNKAKWLFSSQENLDLFKATPPEYAPQYGGHCAWAVAAKNDLVKGDPNFWKIVDGKLYLNYDDSVQKMWLKDIPGFIFGADNNWVGLNK